MYTLPRYEKLKLRLAEKKMGVVLLFADCFWKNPGRRQYIKMAAFRKFCNYRTLLLIANGGGKNVIPSVEMTGKGDCMLLDLGDYCMDGQSVHPDVVYDSKRKCYVMAISEFPFKNDKYENPVILYSTDTTVWNAQNNYYVDVTDIPPGKLGYHSDPGLLIHGEKIYFFDRKVIVERDGLAYISVDRYEQVDNKWYMKGSIFSIKAKWNSHEKYLSPTMVSIDDMVHCWYAEKNQNGFEVIHTSIDSNWKISSSEKCILVGLEENEYVWHLDVCLYESVLYMAADIRRKNTHIISLFYSRDGGITWYRSKLLAASEEGFSEREVYRGSLTVRDKVLYLFYTGRNNSEYWQTAKKVFLMEDIVYNCKNPGDEVTR